MKRKFCVKDILNLESLEGSRLLAGEAFLDNPIDRINIMEVPDVENWVQKDEFLMTTGFMFKDHPEHFINLIPKLKERQIAALGIKPKRFLDTIPPQLIAYAELYHLPLIELPEKTTFSLVIRECMEQILLSEQEKRDEFIRTLLAGNYTTEIATHRLAHINGIELTPHSKYTVLLILHHHSTTLLQKTKFLSLVDKCIQEQHIIALPTIYENQSVIITINNFAKDQHPLELDLKPLEKIALENDFSILLSAVTTKIPAIHMLYEDVYQLLNVTHYTPNKAPIITWDSLGIYSLLPTISADPFAKYSRKKYIDPLISYDNEHKTNLLETLNIYIQCSCNIKKASSHLFMHYNSVCNRINQIKEILQVDLDDINELTCINLAIKLHFSK